MVTSVVQLLCRTTKLGWFDDHQRTIVEDAKRFLEKGSMEHYLLGLKILNSLVAEMNRQPKRQSKLLTVHRKTAVAFRDQELGQIFQFSLLALRQLQNLKAQGSAKLKEQVRSSSDNIIGCVVHYHQLVFLPGSASDLCVACLNRLYSLL